MIPAESWRGGDERRLLRARDAWAWAKPLDVAPRFRRVRDRLRCARPVRQRDPEPAGNPNAVPTPATAG